MICDGAPGKIQRVELWQMSQELYPCVRYVLAVAEGEVREGEADWREAKEGDVAQFLTVCEVEFSELGAVSTLNDVPHTKI